MTDVLERAGYHDVWVFGDDDVRIGTDQGQLLGFDGERWALESTPSTAPVLGLWVLPPNVLWSYEDRVRMCGSFLESCATCHDAGARGRQAA